MAIKKLKTPGSVCAPDRVVAKPSPLLTDDNVPSQESETRRTIQKLTAVTSIAVTLSQARELDALLNDILDTIIRLFETDFAHIMLFDPTAQVLRVRAVRGAPPEFVAGIDNLKSGEGIAGSVYAGGKPMVVHDAINDPRITRRVVRDLGVHALAGVPLMATGECIGVLFTGTQNPDRQVPEDIELLQAIGDQIGMAIENARLFEENLRARQLWESTFNAISDGISVHTRDMQIAKVNRSLAQILNVPGEELVGRACCLVTLDRERPLPDCAEVRATGEAPCQVSEVVERPNGQILRITVDPLVDEEGETFGSVHVVSDITEQVALERQIARAEQLALIGELAAGLAHEVKNPLAGIKGAIEIVRDGLAEDHPNRPVLGHVLNEILRIDRIIGDLLDYARPRPSSRTKTDLNALIERVISTARLQLTNEHVELEFHPAEGLPLMTVDPDELQKVLLNLLINAIQAIKDHGRILTETAFHPSASGGSVVLTVTDTGTGIPPENLDKIFRPFFTSKKRGTGMGLPTCKRIIASYGGTITVESEVGKGSRFIVTLPVHPQAAMVSSPPLEKHFSPSQQAH